MLGHELTAPALRLRREPRILMPAPKSEWMPSSQAQPKNIFGHENRVLFRVRARLADGHVRWRGFFEDREDFDAFLWALVMWREEGVPVPRPIWELPTPSWHPDIDDGVMYEAATLNILTTTGSNQTWTKPVDYADSSNTIECLGAGGAGSAAQVTVGGNCNATGGGSGSYSAISNYAASSSETYNIGAGGTTGTISTNTTSVGTDGADAWFGAATFASAVVASKGGAHGNAALTATAINGGVGGLASASTGTTKRDGARGGNITGTPSTRNATGGAGAPGAAALGNNGGDTASPAGVGTAGGSGDGGAGGTGGTAVTSGQSVGGNGAEWGSAGSGGGGGSTRLGASASTTGCTGGNYGAGGGSTSKNGTTTGTVTGGAGGDGIVVVTYNPVANLSPPFRSMFHDFNHMLVR